MSADFEAPLESAAQTDLLSTKKINHFAAEQRQKRHDSPRYGHQLEGDYLCFPRSEGGQKLTRRFTGSRLHGAVCEDEGAQAAGLVRVEAAAAGPWS